MLRIGVIAAMAGEAERLSVSGARIFHSGVGPVRAAEAARRLLDEGCNGLASAGIAGGLDPALGSGTVVIADCVSAPDGTVFPCDASWRADIVRKINGREGRIVGSDFVVADLAAKHALHATGAVAVDMESHAVARVAAEARVPFIAVRVIADTADTALPEWALRAVGFDGRIRFARALAALLPWRIGTAIELASASRQAHAGLSRVAAALGESFGRG